MESADQVQEAIRLQGVCLGQQVGEISALHQGMEAMRANLQCLAELAMSQLQPALPAPPGLSPRHGSEPRLPAPERYEGDLPFILLPGLQVPTLLLPVRTIPGGLRHRAPLRKSP